MSASRWFFRIALVSIGLREVRRGPEIVLAIIVLVFVAMVVIGVLS